MQSFRTELENTNGQNTIVEKDIIELERKIKLFRDGKIDEEKFRSLRLARGVYGQRQQGVQMIRIKIPFGKLTTRQLLRISEVADKYSTGNLHTTTRQDIQIHYVSLDKTPELWAELEKDNVTLREACGNTVRNVTGSAIAGVDPNEPFDITPYAHSFFEYFLRNPICQELGRKFKVSFSSSEEDTAFSYIHDLGFIPKLKRENGTIERGFKVMIGGGLGAQPFLAHEYTDFLPEHQIIPFAEAVLRVFDRHGERAKRNKARFKYLVQSLGFEEVLKLVKAEHKTLKNKSYRVDWISYKQPENIHYPGNVEIVSDSKKYKLWKDTNLIKQKQSGFYSIKIKLKIGDFSTETARKLTVVVQKYAADDIRITVNQGLLLRFVSENALPNVFNALDALGLAEPGADSIADITACPGTDTCNLGISSSTGIAKALEDVMLNEYPDLIYNNDIKIKISGCMNSCGQHGLAHIGFHGSSLKSDGRVAPALQVLLGGGTVGNGVGRAADKVIKIPSKRGDQALRLILDDYASNSLDGEYFNDYYDRQGKLYFYDLLKELSNNKNLIDEEFIDWGYETTFFTAIGTGECAGVTIDLVSTLLLEAQEKLDNSSEAFNNKKYADAIYHSYSAFVHAAKAFLTTEEVETNTQAGIIAAFDEHFVGHIVLERIKSFSETVYQIRKNEPSEAFAIKYFNQANDFVKSIQKFKTQQHEYQDKI